MIYVCKLKVKIKRFERVLEVEWISYTILILKPFRIKIKRLKNDLSL